MPKYLATDSSYKRQKRAFSIQILTSNSNDSCNKQQPPYILPRTSSSQHKHSTYKMSLFKTNNSSSSASKKNKTASATSTPSQTPRTSVDLKTSPFSNPTATASPQANRAAVSRASYLNNMQAMVLSRV
ncbi:hypothetical protein BGX24_011202 [Mortierella sp. AD032]|nr:hypothetical protein BGX24_011202 [Mortierella sp. AD032]